MKIQRCKVIGCEKGSYKEGYCKIHFKQIEIARAYNKRKDAEEKAEEEETKK